MSQEDIPYHFIKGMVCQFYNGMVCPPATSEAGARWPRFGLVVVATTSRRDNKDQMIRPLDTLAEDILLKTTLAMDLHFSHHEGPSSDTGRIYIKGYLYPILYPKISKKDISILF
jgi:hypothetical protein